jgi:hypothetical protein
MYETFPDCTTWHGMYQSFPQDIPRAQMVSQLITLFKHVYDHLTNSPILKRGYK